MFKGGTCSRVVYVQGWYMLKGGICSRVASSTQGWYNVQGWYLEYYVSTQGWPACVCLTGSITLQCGLLAGKHKF